MKQILLVSFALAAIASAACRQYDVDVYRNVNGKVPQGPNYYVGQTFVCTSDSLLWAEFFVGAANDGGSYYFQVLKGTQALYDGSGHAGDSIHYQYVRANLSPIFGVPKLVKGETYVLMVSLLDPHHPTESLNFYNDSTNPYPYGGMSVNGTVQARCDLSARIEGVNRAVSSEFFGVSDNMPWLDSTRRGRLLSLAESAGVTWIRHGVMLTATDSCPGRWNWTNTDPIFGAFYHHHLNTLAVLGDCQDWLSTRCTLVSCTLGGSGHDTVWCATNKGPPRGLLNSVFTNAADTQINPNNFWADIVYRTVSRYKKGGTFWTSQGIYDYGITDWEIWNEPQFWQPPQRGYDSLRDAFWPDTVGLVEDLYARLCVVACSAAHKADSTGSGAHVIIGGGLSDVFAHKHDGSVDGATWLAGFYRYGGCGGMDSGASVHPYQADSLGLKPDLFAHDLDTIRTIRRLNGDEGKELVVTEFAYGLDSIQNAIALPEAHLISLAGDPVNFYDRVFWFVLHNADKRADSSWPSEMLHMDSATGAVREKACYYAFRQMTQELVGERMNSRVLSGDSATDAKTRVYELEDPAMHKKTWVCWRNYATGGSAVSVKVPARTERLDTSYLARYQTDNQPGYNVMAGPNGWFQFGVDTLPLYVREDTSATDTISRADLAVDSIWTEVVPGQTWPQKRRLWARVRNLGNALSGGGQALTILKFYANGDSVARAICPCLQHGETARVEGDRVWQIANGDPQMVKAVVNEDRAFVELSWDNNSKFRLFLALPILGSQGGVNGPRTMARVSGSSPIQAVAEFTESGKSLVFYCPSLDFANSGWDSVTTGKNPAIGTGPDSLPWITFTRGDTVLCSELNPASAWRTRVIFAPALGQHVGPAALAVFQSRGQWKWPSAALGQVVFPVYSTGSPSSFVLHARFDSLNVTFDTLDKVLVPADRDSAVSLCSGIADTLHTAYSRNTTTCYRTARYDTLTSPTSIWSGAKQFGGGTVLAVHPYLEQFKDRVWMVFRQTITGGPTSIMRVSHAVATPYSNWTSGAAVSDVNLAPKDFPVLSSDEVSAWAESTAGHWHIRARVRDSINDLSASDSTANHPHILADTSIDDGPSRDRLKVRGLWASKAAGDTWYEACSDRNFDRSAAAANATESNNGRKLVKQTNSSGTYLHMVYHTKAGAVYYAEAPAGNSQWSRTDLGGGDHPCIDLDSANKRLYVAYRNDSSPGIKCQTRSTDSTTWQKLTVYSCGSASDSTNPGAPAIVASRYDPSGKGKTAAYCVFALQNHLRDSSFVVLVKLTQGGVQDIDTLDRAALGVDSLPAISARTGDFLSVAWQRGTEIYYRVSTDSVRPDTNRAITWSNSHNLSNTLGWSRHPSLETGKDTLLAVWAEGDTGKIMAKGQAIGSAYNTWGDAVTLSSDSNPCDYPTVAADDDSLVVAWQVKTGANTRIINARVNFGNTRTIVARNDPVAFPHVAFETAIQDSDTVCYIDCAYSEEPSSNYYEACCDRYDLSSGSGGGGQSAGIFDPGIKPMLFAPAPNPFNGMTCIRYQTNVKGLIRVSIMDITGRRVRNLLTMPQKPGIYTLTWDARDDRERCLARGVYFVRLETPNYHEARKLVLTR